MATDEARRERAQKFGERLRRRREELDLKQEDVGRRMTDAVSGNVISRWERGVNMPRDRYVIQLAEVLAVSPDFLWANDRPAIRTPAQTDALLSRLGAIEDKLDRLERLASIDEQMHKLVAALTGTDGVDVVRRAAQETVRELADPEASAPPASRAPRRARRSAG